MVDDLGCSLRQIFFILSVVVNHFLGRPAVARLSQASTSFRCSASCVRELTKSQQDSRCLDKSFGAECRISPPCSPCPRLLGSPCKIEIPQDIGGGLAAMTRTTVRRRLRRRAGLPASELSSTSVKCQARVTLPRTESTAHPSRKYRPGEKSRK